MLIKKIAISLLFSSFIIVQLASFLTEEECRIALDVANQLKIHHCILYFQSETNDIDISKFKKFSSKYVFTRIIKNEDELFENVIFSKTKLRLFQSDVMIVLKGENISLVERILSNINGMYKNRMANFKWLYFLEDANFDTIFDANNPLRISYNCEFIFVQRENLTVYQLREIYACNDILFHKDVTTWDGTRGLAAFPDVPLRLRRKNLKGSDIEVLIPEECLQDNVTNPRLCNALEVVRDLSVIMNFTIIQNPFTDIRIPFINFIYTESDILGGGYPWTGVASKEIALSVGPIYKATLNWYIRYPTVKLESDYYLKPFEFDFWMAVLLSITIGTLFSIIIVYLLKVATGNHDRTIITSNLFIGLETLCNQSGSEEPNSESYHDARSLYENYSMMIVRNESSTEMEVYLNKVCNGKVAVALFDNDIYKLNSPCDLLQIESPLSKTFIYISLKSSSPFQNIFNEIYVRFYEVGIQKRMQKKIYVEPWLKVEDQDFYSVEMEQMVQVFLLPLVGIAVSLLLFLLELTYKKFTGA